MSDFKVNLLVPYSSQWDADADDTRDDCGPCSIKQILNYFEGKSTFTTDEIFVKSGAVKDSLISIQQMLNAISACGYEASYYTGQSIETLKGYLDSGLPVIPLVHYGAFTSRQDTGYAKGHFFVVVGYRDDGYLVNDPDFYAPRRDEGDHHFYTKEDFEKGWSTCSKDGNPNFAMIVIRKKQPIVEIDYEKLYNECRKQRDDNHNDRMALYEELGFTGDFNRSVAVEKIKYYRGLEGEIKKRDEAIKELEEKLRVAKEELQKIKEQTTAVKETTQEVKTNTESIEIQTNQTTQKVNDIEKQIKNIINEEPMKGFFQSLWELIKKHLKI